MTEKKELKPGSVFWRKGDDQPIIEPEVVKAEVVETDDVEKEKRQGSRTWETEFQRWFEVSPFPLTAEKLAGLVRRVDWEGPQLFGVYYPAILRKECSLLVPQPVYGLWDLRYRFMLETWARNTGFFRCPAIGQVLEIYQMGGRNHADCKTGKK